MFYQYKNDYLAITSLKKMTISYIEWRTREVEKSRDYMANLVKQCELLGINTNVLLIALQATIEHLYSKETLIWFLQNQDKIENE